MGQREVLIVDDDRQVRDVQHQSFLGARHKYLLAHGRQEGVQVFRAAVPGGRSPPTVTDLKRPSMGGIDPHSRRVHGYALATARVYGVPEPDLPALAHGVLLHDIGKIGIPDGILLKPGPLTEDEWKIMRRHPEIGKQLIEKIPFLQGAVPIVYSHHEQWDGTGYPRGLRGEDIPLGAR